MSRLKYILLIIALLIAGKLAGQNAVIDSVCSGSAFHYRVEGEMGSTYVWELTMPDGTIEILPSDADTILIHWNYPAGTYRLTVLQFNDEFDCDAVPQEGDIIIFGLPQAPIAENFSTCFDGEEHKANATSLPGTSIVWYETEEGFDLIEQPRASEPGIYTAWAAAIDDETGCENPERTKVTLTIHEPLLVQCPDDIELTTHTEPFELSGSIPEGGLYEGAGVASNVFSPMEAGVGVHEIFYTYVDENGCSATCSFLITVMEAEPELFITKAASQQTYSFAGEEITYTIMLENTGNVGVYSITLVDELTGDDWIIESLAAGVSQTLTTSLIITQEHLDAGSLTNLVLAEGEDAQGAIITATASATITADAQPALAMTMTASQQTYSQVGEEITYTITVENTGNLVLRNLVLNDPLTGLNTSVANLGPGETRTFSTQYSIGQPDIEAGILINTAYAQAYYAAGNPIYASAIATVTALIQPEMRISLAALPVTYSTEGETITFSTSIENTGNVALTDIRVTDAITGSVQYIAELSPGATISVHNEYVTTIDDLYAGRIDNSSSINAGTRAGNTLNDIIHVSVLAEFNQLIANDIDLTNNQISGHEGGLLVENILFNDLLNNRPIELEEVNISVVEAAGTPGIKLNTTTGELWMDPGTPSGFYTLTYQICEIKNPANCDQATIYIAIMSVADLAIAMEADKDPVTAGDQIVYTMRMVNHGPDHAEDVVLTNALDHQLANPVYSLNNGTTWQAWTGSLGAGRLMAGQEVVILVRATLIPGATEHISSTATVESTTYDPIAENNQVTVVSAVTASADLEISKQAPEEIFAGEELTFTISIINMGPSVARDVVVQDILANDLELLSTQPSRGTWSGNEWSIGMLGNGESATLLITTRVNAGITDGSIISNTAIAFSETPDPDVSNNTSSTQTQVRTLADLAINKTAEQKTIAAGEDAVFNIVLTNKGPSTAHNIVVHEFLPDILTDVQASANKGIWEDPYWTINSLLPGETATLILRSTTDPSTEDGLVLTNKAKVTSSTIDPDLSNNTSQADILMRTVADLAVIKMAQPDTLVAGGEATYIIILSNKGPSDARNVKVTDHLPEEVVITSMNTTIGEWSGHLWDIGYLPALQQDTLFVNVLVAPDINEGTLIRNTAKATSDTHDPQPANNSYTTENYVTTRADLSIHLTARSEPAIAGEPLLLDITVTNHGPSHARDILITKNFGVEMEFVNASNNGQLINGNEIQWELALLAIEQSIELTAEVFVKPDVAHNSQANAIAEVVAETFDPFTDNNQSALSIPVHAVADLRITALSETDTVIAGTEFDQLLIIENDGPSYAGEINVTIESCSSITGNIYSFDNGQTWHEWTSPAEIASISLNDKIEILVRSTVCSSARGYATNIATLSSTTIDPNEDNNTASLSKPVKALADMELKLSCSETIPVAGRPFLYRLSITNKGPSDAENVEVHSQFPAYLEFIKANFGGVKSVDEVSWNIEYLEANQTIEMQMEVHAPSYLRDNTEIVKKSHVISRTEDPDLSNNHDSIIVLITTLADLEITKEVLTPTALGGTMVDYRITLRNYGPSYASNVTVVDQLPEGLSFVSTNGNGHYIPYDHSIIWTIDNVPDNDQIVYTTTLRVGREVIGGSILTNHVMVSSSTNDPDENKRFDSADLLVETSNELFVPEGFSPNDDGINDYFVIGGLLDLHPDNAIKIFDRWGNLVFEETPYQNRWDGRHMNGRIMPSGTYYYILDLGRGQETVRGFIYLIR